MERSKDLSNPFEFTKCSLFALWFLPVEKVMDSPLPCPKSRCSSGLITFCNMSCQSITNDAKLICQIVACHVSYTRYLNMS